MVYLLFSVQFSFTSLFNSPLSMRDHGLFGDGSAVSYTMGVGLKATDMSGVDTTTVSALATAAEYIVVCVGEGTYAEKPGDIDDLALPQVRNCVTSLICGAVSCDVTLLGKQTIYYSALLC